MSRSKQTSADVTAQIKADFENLAKSITPITVKSQSEAMEAVAHLESMIKEDKEWDVQINGMNRAMALINGGLLAHKLAVKEFSKIGCVLVTASQNLRSALVKVSTALLAHLAKELEEDFDMFGEVIQPLSTQTSHGTQIIADSCKYVILAIIENVPTKRTIRGTLDLAASKAGPNRRIAAEGLGIALERWKGSIIDRNGGELAAAIIKMLSDAQAEVRLLARATAGSFLRKFPNKAREITDRIDERTRNQIMSQGDGAAPEQKEVQQVPKQAQTQVPKKRRGKSQLPMSTRMSAQAKERETQRFEMPPPRMPRNRSPAQHKPGTAQVHQRRSQSPVSNKGYNIFADAVAPATRASHVELLEKMEEYVNTNRWFMIGSSKRNFASELVAVATTGSKPAKERAEALIESLLERFPAEFEGSLPVLFGTFFGKNDAIIRALQSLYDPNKVLAVVVERRPLSLAAVELIAVMCRQKDISLQNADLRATLAIIAEQHKNEAIKAALTEVTEDDAPPKCNLKDIDGWCAAVRKYVDDLSDNEWHSKRGLVFKDLAMVVGQTNNRDSVFHLMMDMLTDKGCDAFDLFVQPVIEQWDDKHAHTSRAVLEYMRVHVDNQRLIRASLEQTHNTSARNALEVISVIFERCSSAELVKDVVPETLKTLCTFMNDQSANVRKSCVFCFVAISRLFASLVEASTYSLPQTQRRLVDIYRQR